MTIRLPEDVEKSVLAEVHRGHFASIDEALAEAWRAFERQRPTSGKNTELGSIGAMRADAEFLDQAVEHAMKVREERPWRLNAVE